MAVLPESWTCSRQPHSILGLHQLVVQEHANTKGNSNNKKVFLKSEVFPLLLKLIWVINCQRAAVSQRHKYPWGRELQDDLDGHSEVSWSLGLTLCRCRECHNQQGFFYNLGKTPIAWTKSLGDSGRSCDQEGPMPMVLGPSVMAGDPETIGIQQLLFH